MTRGALFVSGIVLLAGCAAGSAEGGPTGDEPSSAPMVELVVRNEQQSTLSAYVQWRGGNPTRLGEIAGGATRNFDAALRGTEVRVIFVTPGQTAGGGDDSDVPFSSVNPADRIEWVIHGDGSVFYRRLR
jgi:hypothetical protein